MIPGDKMMFDAPLRAAWRARKQAWEGDDFDVHLLADCLPPAALEAAVEGKPDGPTRQAWLVKPAPFVKVKPG